MKREWTPTDPNEPATGHGNPTDGGDPGVTKREYFASKAFAALIASEVDIEFSLLAKDAVEAADALIDALNEGGKS